MFVRAIMLCLAFGLPIAFGQPETLRLTLPVVEENPGQHTYYHALLREALADSGVVLQVEERSLPYQRIDLALQDGDIALAWFMETAERNRRYRHINVNLTQGLMGQRVLLIRPQDQAQFKAVNSLQALQRLHKVAGFGRHWFDADVWASNDLTYREADGDWRSIYRMLAHGREYDYFPRSVIEVRLEQQRYPDLAIERHLLLRYNRDFHYYISPTLSDASFHLLDRALKQARRSGTLRQMTEWFWQDDLTALGYDQRKVIDLEAPSLHVPEAE